MLQEEILQFKMGLLRFHAIQNTHIDKGVKG